MFWVAYSWTSPLLRKQKKYWFHTVAGWSPAFVESFSSTLAAWVWCLVWCAKVLTASLMSTHIPDLRGDRAEDAMEALFQQTSDFDLTFTLHTAVPKKHAWELPGDPMLWGAVNVAYFVSLVSLFSKFESQIGKGLASGYVECIASGYASCIASGYLNINIIIIIIIVVVVVVIVVNNRHISWSSLSSSCWPSWGIGGWIPHHHVVH